MPNGLRPVFGADGSLEGLKFDIEVSVGPVWTTIAEAIEDKRSAALVLGTHGRTGLQQAGAGLGCGVCFPGSAVPGDDRRTESVAVKILRRRSQTFSRANRSLSRIAGGPALWDLAGKSHPRGRDPALCSRFAVGEQRPEHCVGRSSECSPSRTSATTSRRAGRHPVHREDWLAGRSRHRVCQRASRWT